MEFELDVLEALVTKLGLGRVSVFGYSYGGVMASAFAARRARAGQPPAALRRLRRGFGDRVACAAGLGLCALGGLELGSRLLAEAFIPDADRENDQLFTRPRRESCDGEMAASLLELWARTDVRDVLGSVPAQTTVLHRREDPVVPSTLGRQLAALIDGARFELLEGRCHPRWLGDTPAVFRACGASLRFIPPHTAVRGRSADLEVGLTRRERVVLQLVAKGHSCTTITERLVLSAHTVYRHVANIRARLDQPSRAAAAVHAARLGLM